MPMLNVLPEGRYTLLDLPETVLLCTTAVFPTLNFPLLLGLI